MNGKQRVIIENVKPHVNYGEFPIKRVLNEQVKVTADIICDSHDMLGAEVIFKHNTESKWHHVSMEPHVNDEWKSEFSVSLMGSYQYTVIAWVDHFKSWHRDILKRIEAKTDYAVDLMVGAEIIHKVINEYPDIPVEEKQALIKISNEFLNKSEDAENRIQNILNNSLYNIIEKYPVKDNMSRFHNEYEVIVEHQKANFSTWYEVFPRSLSKETGVHGTFKDCEAFMPYVADMGFDVLYLPPIHPIGETNRKGKNNNVNAQPGEPGSPWAIGDKNGGHKSIHPELGTMDDFKSLIAKAKELGIDIALDIAFQCSPDHPYVKDHPKWFKQRPDGSLQYAENPPKKYQDIYPINFESDDWENLWEELKSVITFWIEKGVTIFRVDNPHTKSFPFWGWLIEDIKKEHPEIIFLAEAFTRPKVMYQLAKRGFTQSYTYFSWRNTKYEITQYCNELIKTEVRDFFRPNFWPNTPDILPEFLQVTNRAGFIQRLILAATLSSNYGIYGPAFELLENTPIQFGKEEYLDSEKFEIKNWDFNKPNIKNVISRVNTIRKENAALQNTHSLTFHDINNEALICYSKASDDLSNIILVVVNLDPDHTHSGWMHLPVQQYGMDVHAPFQVHDLLGGSYYLWHGENNYVEIDPGVMPAHIFKIRRKVRTEHDFDYFM